MRIARVDAGEIASVTVSPGECLQASLEKAVKDLGARAAMVLTAVGSVTRLVFANPRSLDKNDRQVGVCALDGPLEIVSLVGGVGPGYAHEQADSHMHVCASAHDGTVVGGSLRYGSTAWFEIRVVLLVHA